MTSDAVVQVRDGSAQDPWRDLAAGRIQLLELLLELADGLVDRAV